MIDAFGPVRQFERAICEYTGAKYSVTTNSCTMALLLAMVWYKNHGGKQITIPRETYPSVPMCARHAGLDIVWTGSWKGVYQMPPSNIVDCAKRFTSDMYIPHTVQCVSFHVAKNLKLGQGGAILHDDPAADVWYRQARFDGRTEGVETKDDTYTFAGWHCYLSPDVAARGLWLMQSYPQRVPDQEMHAYPDMSRWSFPE